MTATTACPVRSALWHATLYRTLGFNPLPSRDKRPMVRYADLWDTPAPAEWFTDRRWRADSVQVMTGRRWNLCVLDIDGPDAVAFFAANWARQLPATWKVWHSRGGRDSFHLWFRIDDATLPERRKRVIWGEWDDATNAWKKRCAIELLCDRSLIVAPPSIHPKTGNAYSFSGRGPHNLARPAKLPGWVWRLPAVEPPAHARPPEPPRVLPAPRGIGRLTGGVTLGHVLDALTDKSAVARECWGLRFARDSQPSQGWVSVHDPFREDAHPSARFHVETGGLWLPGERVIPFCKIPVQLGLFTSWQDAAADLADRYHVRPR